MTNNQKLISNTSSNLPTNKIVFFLFNIFLILLSGSYLGVGCWLVDSLEKKPDINVINDFYNTIGGLMIAAGITGLLLSLYGFVISIWRNLYSVFIYTSIIIILILYGIAIGIIGLVYADLAKNHVKDSVTEKLFTGMDRSSVILTDDIQRTFRCCGLNRSSDWTEIFKQASVPPSCCSESCLSTDYFKEGCLNAITKSIRTDMGISGGISLALALIMILGLVLSIHSLYEVFEKKSQIQYKASVA